MTSTPKRWRAWLIVVPYLALWALAGLCELLAWLFDGLCEGLIWCAERLTGET